MTEARIAVGPAWVNTIPPDAGEWQVLLAVPAVRVSDLLRADLPAEPGVYLWCRDGQAVYIGTASSLRGRLWGHHLGVGVSLSGSSLRRNVCELLFGIPPSITGRPTRQKVTPAQAVAIRDWLFECDLSWQPCASARDADHLERRLRAAFLPPLNRV